MFGKNKNELKRQLAENRLYKWMQGICTYMDKYYIDGVIGILPWGIGDLLGALFSIISIFFSIFYLRSIPLTLAILNNTLRDVFLGLIPFYIGDVIDFMHKANIKNMRLIDGFINDDKQIISKINKKAIQSFVVIIMFFIGIFMMFKLLLWIAESIGTWLFT